MKNWLKNRNILDYVVRQGQSCDYLESHFNRSLRDKLDGDGCELLDRLIVCHKRQKQDITNIIGNIPECKVSSFYFGEMVDNNTNTMMLLSIQYVSYLRGKKRYKMLMNHETKKNKKFIRMWQKFYVDASHNAYMTLDYILGKWGVKVMVVIWFLMLKEQFLIRKINKHNASR